jgi:hypothetical protein
MKKKVFTSLNNADENLED